MGKLISLLSYKLEKLKKLHGYVDIDMLTENEKKQLGKPLEITDVRFIEK